MNDRLLSSYSAVVLLVTEHLTAGTSGALTRLGVLVIAFSFDPLHRFLEGRVDRLLFPASRRHAALCGRS